MALLTFYLVWLCLSVHIPPRAILDGPPFLLIMLNLLPSGTDLEKQPNGLMSRFVFWVGLEHEQGEPSWLGEVGRMWEKVLMKFSDKSGEIKISYEDQMCRRGVKIWDTKLTLELDRSRLESVESEVRRVLIISTMELSYPKPAFISHGHTGNGGWPCLMVEGWKGH